jgi:PPK2 family polyphosphate:nucleotide phosphotransferase
MLLKPIKLGDDIDLSDDAAKRPDKLAKKKKETLEEETSKLTVRLDELQQALYAEGKRSLLVVFQARDAGGKDGVIRRVFGPLNQIGTQVTAFNAPTEDELAHDYLWRIHSVAPPRGSIGIFNRSHYEDVLAVRVHGLAPEEVWRRRFDHINEFERILTDEGTTIVKFFLHISQDEQKERFLERLDDPTKNWKFRPGDLKDRELWEEYNAAYAEAISRCSTAWAPWYVVPADSKRGRDYLVARVMVEVMEEMAPRFPDPDPTVLAYRDQIR